MNTTSSTVKDQIPSQVTELVSVISRNMSAEKAAAWQQEISALLLSKDLSRIWSEFACWRLTDREWGMLNYARTEEERQTIRHIAKLFQEGCTDRHKWSTAADWIELGEDDLYAPGDNCTVGYGAYDDLETNHPITSEPISDDPASCFAAAAANNCARWAAAGSVAETLRWAAYAEQGKAMGNGKMMRDAAYERMADYLQKLIQNS